MSTCSPVEGQHHRARAPWAVPPYLIRCQTHRRCVLAAHGNTPRLPLLARFCFAITFSPLPCDTPRPYRRRCRHIFVPIKAMYHSLSLDVGKGLAEILPRLIQYRRLRPIRPTADRLAMAGRKQELLRRIRATHSGTGICQCRLERIRAIATWSCAMSSRRHPCRRPGWPHIDKFTALIRCTWSRVTPAVRRLTASNPVVAQARMRRTCPRLVLNLGPPSRRRDLGS